jgi:hypothetical protein
MTTSIRMIQTYHLGIKTMFKLTLPQIMDFLDLQIENYNGADRSVLVKACNLIHEHLYDEEQWEESLMEEWKNIFADEVPVKKKKNGKKKTKKK